MSFRPFRIGRVLHLESHRLVLHEPPLAFNPFDLVGKTVALSHRDDGLGMRLGVGRVRCLIKIAGGACAIDLEEDARATIATACEGDWVYLVETPEARIEDLARQVHATGSRPNALPIGQSFALVGRWRVYFNRHGATGRPWCIAPEAGGWEVAVSSVGISTVAETVYRPKATPDDEDGRPSAWIAVDGYLTVHASGHASIGAP